MTPIGSVGIELWSMSDMIYFDNILITDDLSQANAWAAATYDLKMSKIGAAEGGMFSRILDYSNKNPWLYAVYVVVIGLPLVLIITFCCSGSKSPPTGHDAMPEHPKKTDEVQDDDDLEQDEVDEDEAEEEGSEEDAEASDDNAELIPEASENKKSSPRRRKVRKD